MYNSLEEIAARISDKDTRYVTETEFINLGYEEPKDSIAPENSFCLSKCGIKNTMYGLGGKYTFDGFYKISFIIYREKGTERVLGCRLFFNTIVHEVKRKILDLYSRNLIPINIFNNMLYSTQDRKYGYIVEDDELTARETVISFIREHRTEYIVFKKEVDSHEFKNRENIFDNREDAKKYIEKHTEPCMVSVNIIGLTNYEKYALIDKDNYEYVICEHKLEIPESLVL